MSPNPEPPFQTQQERIAELERELTECRRRLPFPEGVVTWEQPAHYNAANEAALSALIEEAYRLGIPRYLLALWLAARGVLVPAVLTDEQTRNGDAFGVRELGYDSGTWYEIDREQMAYTLERIARGNEGA